VGPALPDGREPRPKPMRKSGDLNDTVYRMLKEMILSGRLRPGNRLVHQDLADQLSVSRTPVRESLERLYQEGYAGRRPRRGYHVAEFNTADARDLYETREALEIFAFRKTCERGFSRAAISRLQALNRDYARMFPESVSRRRLQLDEEFHLTLAGFSTNPFLCRTLAAVFEKIGLKRRLDGYGLIVNDDPLRDHQALVQAIADGRLDEAEQVLTHHIRQACLRLLHHLDVNGAVPLAGETAPEGHRRPPARTRGP
jgi:GntR family transcriptional regulator, rspAB operon transcriptional repressor